MPGGLGGEQSSTTQLPAWLEQPARRNIGRAEEMSQIGYMPNFGPEVAAFAPQQVQAMKNQNRMASAYGMGGGGGLNIPKPKEFAGGVQGYSSMPMFREMRDRFAQARPGQMDAYNAQFINPWTGAAPTSQFALQQTQAIDPMTGQIVDSGPLADPYPGAGGVDGGGFGEGGPGGGMGDFGGGVGGPSSSASGGWGGNDADWGGGLW